MGIALQFHPSEYPPAVRAQLKAGLMQHRVPPRFLYESPGQAARWMAYAQQWAPLYQQETIEQLYRDAYDGALAMVEGEALAYVGLGCGDGVKDVVCVQRARERGFQVQASLTDCSPSLLLEAALRPAIGPCQCLVVDLMASLTRGDLVVEEQAMPRLWTCFGMAPTIGHAALLPRLQEWIAPGESLLLSANLLSSAAEADRANVLAQYDNAPAREWYAGYLVDLGIPREEFDLSVVLKELPDVSGAFRIAGTARLHADRTVRPYGMEIPLAAGAEIELFGSERWLPEAWLDCLGSFGFEVRDRWVATTREEGIYLLQRH